MLCLAGDSEVSKDDANYADVAKINQVNHSAVIGVSDKGTDDDDNDYRASDGGAVSDGDDTTGANNAVSEVCGAVASWAVHEV